jgi:molybdopterin molybdotransferase
MITTMPAELIEVDAARELILGCTGPLSAEPVPIAEGLGRTLAEAVGSNERVPGFDNSAMDGYAVRVADLAGAGAGRQVTLRVVDESRAGTPAARKLDAGEAIAISTGAAMPAGADAVVRVEDTVGGSDGTVSVGVAAEPGANVRRAGEDIEPGEVLIAAGAGLGPVELGVLASIGHGTVSCRRRPTVSVISTGDELIGVDEPLRPGSVRNSNVHSLPALARRAGAELAEVGRAPDDPEATVAALERGIAADVLVVCGGVSVGEHDHVKAAFAELGVEQRFWGVSLKPGKPAWFGTRAGTLVFGLPGNPVSAYVTFLLFVRPALLALQGADPATVRGMAALTTDYEKPTDRAHAVRCGLELTESGWLARPAPHQGSHVMTSLLGADALALIPRPTARVEAGERVTVELLP